MNTKGPNDSLLRSTRLPPEKELNHPGASVRRRMEEGGVGDGSLHLRHIPLSQSVSLSI